MHPVTPDAPDHATRRFHPGHVGLRPVQTRREAAIAWGRRSPGIAALLIALVCAIASALLVPESDPDGSMRWWLAGTLYFVYWMAGWVVVWRILRMLWRGVRAIFGR